MKTYYLSSISLRERAEVPLDGIQDAVETRHCALGVYLQERHPEELAKHYEDGDAGSAYEFLSRECSEDMDKMDAALRKLFLAAFPADDGYIHGYHMVYRANDAGIPIDMVKKALAAVGIDVELEERRDTTSQMRYKWRGAQNQLDILNSIQEVK